MQYKQRYNREIFILNYRTAFDSHAVRPSEIECCGKLKTFGSVDGERK